MSLHCAFLFPRNEFKLVFMTTIGCISDNMFYRLNFQTGQTQIQLNPHGRSYQAFTTNHKRGLVVLADYGKNPNISFGYIHKKQSSVEIKDICTLQIDNIQLSLNCKYLLVSCGIPERRIIVVDVESHKLLKGQSSFIELEDRKVRRMEFNPANNKIFAVMFQNEIQIYQITEQFKKQEYGLQENIKIEKKGTITSQTAFETFLWDQINNIYTSNGKTVGIYESQAFQQIISYDLEGDFQGQVISNFILTPKHLLIVYCNGRIQWILKYYPDLMEEQEISKKPFYLERYYQFSQQILYATYDHTFSQICVSHKLGSISVLKKAAQTNENQDEEEDNNKPSKQNKSDKDKKIEAEVVQIGSYHAHPIILCRQVKDKAIVMTVSSAGKIIFWSLIQKKAILFLQTNFQASSADVNSNFTLLCLSNKKGIVRFLSIADFENIYLVKQFKLVEKGQINQVQFSSNSQQVACLSTNEKRVFYLLADQINQIQVLGYVNLPYKPVSICWNKTAKTLIKPKFQHLLCCIGFGIIMINGPAAVSSKLRGKQFELNCDVYALRTDPEQKCIEVLPNGEILSTGSDKILNKYKQPQDVISKFNPESKSPIPPPLEEIESHDLETTYMRVYNKVFISCGANGTLEVRSIDNFTSVISLQVNGWKNANLSVAGASSIDGLFFTGGKNGCLSIWKTKQVEIRSTDQIKKEKSNYPKIKSAGDSLKFYQVAVEDEYLQKMKDTISKKKKDQLDKITKIKSELKQLLAENQTHDELEKMTRDEFVIDLQLKDKITKIAVENCEKIKKQSIRNVLYNQVYRNKLKQLTWDQMQEHLRAINGLKNNYIVYNYQIRKIGYEERRKLQVVLDLRRNQIRELKKRGKSIIDVEFYKNKNVINGGILQPLILTVIQKKDDKKQEKNKKKKQEEVVEKQAEEVEQLPKQEIWQLLYSSFQLFSDNAKVNQIIIMQNIIIKIKEAFNKQFNKLLKFRQNQNQMINDKNKRIIQICDQLKRKHEVVLGKKNILQNPDLILEVNNKDIPFPRYLSREQRQKLEKQRLKEQERLRALAEDDSSQRALQKMMGGTLEQKKTSVLQVTVERQKWMDKPPEQMSEQEKNKLKQFEQKRIKAEEQKQRIVKKLEAELRRLKSQIDDIMEKYDQKLFSLLRRRIEYDLRIQQEELYCIKLALSISNYKEDSSKLNELKSKQALYEQKIQYLENQYRLLQGQQEQIQKVRQQKKASLDMKRLGEMQTKVKTIQKSVFEQYQSNVKKRRQIEQKLVETDHTVSYQIIALDPMKQLESKNLSNQIAQQFKFFVPEIKNMQQTYDFPDSLYSTLENRFNIRKQENQIERKLKGIKDSLRKLQQKINSQRNNQQQDEKQIQRLQKELDQSKSDLEILFRIRKGFVQIDSETPVPQLGDALLLAKQKIDKRNSEIITKAQLKIQIMEQIKTCKITVTEQSLDLERKQAQIDRYSSMIKEVQMLKVKKEMQTALAKKDTKINENELRSLKEQIQKVRKQGEKRISLFEKKIEKVNQEIEAIRKENKQLDVQKWNLQNTVKQREKIKDMMVGQNGQGNQQAAEKFQQISINRKLFDKAKQQTDEIQLLREQLSKLKAKTFANFSSVQR